MFDLSLLPTDPEAFFGLQDGYDRRDLKRAYGKAIRQYKPETHPAEFQSIREAYEGLEQALRYGQNQRQQRQAIQAWENTSAADESAKEAFSLQPEQRAEKTSKQELSLRELALVDQHAAIKKFDSTVRKTPPDYYIAAILTDAIEGKSTQKYLAVLLEGFAAFPSDPGLSQLIAEYLRNETPDHLIAKTLQYTAKKIPEPAFYALTEPLWLRLLEGGAKFEAFRALLENCERQIRQTGLSAKDAFYLRLVRSAVWIAPPDWTTNVIQELESRSASMDEESQADLEFAVEIRNILRSEQSPRPHQVRMKLRHALKLACAESSHRSLRAILALLDEIARDTSGVQEAFPLEQSKHDEGWVAAVYRLVSQLQPFIMEVDESVSPERQMEQTDELLNDLTQSANALMNASKSAENWYRTVPLMVLTIGGGIFGAIPIMAISMMISQSETSLLITALGIGVLVVALIVSFFTVIFPRYLKERMEKKSELDSLRAYGENWRSRLFRYARSSSDSQETNLAKILFLSERTGRENLGYAVQYFVSQDTGLQIYSILQLIRS